MGVKLEFFVAEVLPGKRKITMISALCWVKKGAALSRPEKYQLSDEEFERIQKQMGVQLLDAKLELNNFQETMESNSDTEEMMNDVTEIEKAEKKSLEPGNLSIYNLDTYDDEETIDADKEEHIGKIN